MATPEAEDKPAPSPLDSERARLRQDGYTDAEVSQILIARAAGGSQQSTGAGGQGVFSNVLSSLIAVAAHARAAMPSFKKDFETMFDGAASASSRVGASVSLAIKAVVIAVLGYAAWQEWNQHIISATEIAAIQARKLHAEECSARAEAAANNMHISDVSNGIYKGNEELARDCDPNYAHRKALEATCNEKFKAIFAPIANFRSFDSRLGPFTDTLEGRLAIYKAECPITDANREYMRQQLVAMQKLAGLPSTTAPSSGTPEQPHAVPTPAAPEQTTTVSPPPPAPAKTLAAVTSDQLTLRREPDRTSEAIIALNMGAQVEVLSTESNGWQRVQVSDNGTTFAGYVNGKYLTEDLSATPVPIIATEPYDVSRPSFCGSEGAPMEYVICSNADLASQDSAMARSYFALIARSNDSDAVRRSQRRWLSDRAQNCNIPASGRPAKGIPASMVQCVLKVDEARKRSLRMGQY
jgi:uncharacterized protein YecT (DUF1311 family)